MSEMCYRCFKPKSNCLCPYIKEADTGVKFIILMHPKEAYHQRTGTGRLTALCLKDSEILIGVDFTNDPKLNALLENPAYQPVMLYPGDEAMNAKTLVSQDRRTLLVVVIDGTWPCAKKMIRLSKNLQRLPTISFVGDYRSTFTFKREPLPQCLSTIESCYYLLKELQNAGKARNCDVESMLTVFSKMVGHQMESERERREDEERGVSDSFHDRKGRS